MKITYRGLIFISLLFVYAVAVVGQESEFNDAVKKISDHIQLVDSVSGRFQQDKTISVLPKPLKSSGEFSYSSVNGLEWNTQQPIPSRLIFDKDGIRQEMDGKILWQVEAEQPAVATITRVIVSVLALDWQTLDDYFSISANYDGGQWQIDLVPKEQVLLQLIASLTVTGNRQLEKMTLYEANKDRTEIYFTFMDLGNNK